MRRWQRQDGASVPEPPTVVQILNTDSREDADPSESYRARISYCTRTRARAVSTISAVDILIEDIPDIDLVEVAALVVGAHRILLTVVGHPKVGLRHVREEGTSRRYDPVLEAVCFVFVLVCTREKEKQRDRGRVREEERKHTQALMTSRPRLQVRSLARHLLRRVHDESSR